MAESVPVRCPACHRVHAFTPPTFPCPCGAPLTVPVLPDGEPAQLEHRTWKNSWVTLSCPTCGRQDDWPHPELGCACGAVLRPPVNGTTPAPPGRDTVPAPAAPLPGPPLPRPPFHPVTIRTGRDAVAAAAQYLKWLGHTDVAQASDRSATGVDLRGKGIVALVDPSTSRTPRRDVETLWLNCLNEDATGAFFSLAGYAHDARLRADELGVPLFVMDLTGAPQPVNDAADALIRSRP
ncbi:hypothetical protein NGB36_21660 [Streptomyces sp. RB6PN25]|uniref:Restriction endonuclease type IV Mrr domain-containing protein n=1 Tax=Streptomyces humicola TaxID=2953240 RepID=A0ABT1PZP7_9ACTN|nr:hypothetical protein [Streptomyces humicola]MCQ4083141.1 hypothetical protein [Streptomyces humicola]